MPPLHDVVDGTRELSPVRRDPGQVDGGVPVFVDQTGRRRRVAAAMGGTLALLLVASLALFAVGLLTGGGGPLPGWPERLGGPRVHTTHGAARSTSAPLTGTGRRGRGGSQDVTPAPVPGVPVRAAPGRAAGPVLTPSPAGAPGTVATLDAPGTASASPSQSFPGNSGSHRADVRKTDKPHGKDT